MNDAPTPNLATLVVANANLLNLALPGRAFYPNSDPYDADEYQRKIAWLGSKPAPGENNRAVHIRSISNSFDR